MILVELQPQVRQRVGRVVGVGYRLGAAYTLVFVVEFGGNDVIGFLLPILVSGRTRSGAVGVWRGKKLLKLLELPRDMVGGIANALRSKA